MLALWQMLEGLLLRGLAVTRLSGHQGCPGTLGRVLAAPEQSQRLGHIAADKPDRVNVMGAVAFADLMVALAYVLPLHALCLTLTSHCRQCRS